MRVSIAPRPAPGSSIATAELRLPVVLLGDSEPARAAREALQVAAARRSPVLLLAEAGCGVRGVAECLHAGARSRDPLVTLDCSGGAAADIDRRLFGEASRRGAASELESLGRGSALVEAAGGTLFLENIDELPASAQRRLARLLRDGEARVASRHGAVTLAFRLVASTARDLDSDVREGRFRADLLRRFAAGRIPLPALRHRPADLGAIVERLLRDLGERHRALTQAAVTVLAALPWPGNIDELASALPAVLADAGAVVTQEDVLARVPLDGAFPRMDLSVSLKEARRRFERDYIAAVLERHQWRMSEAAEALGIERANLYRKTRQLGIVRIPKAQVS